jgi:hypothetical protein
MSFCCFITAIHSVLGWLAAASLRTLDVDDVLLVWVVGDISL